MVEADVDWKPTDLTRFLRTQGATQSVVDAAGRIRRQRQSIEELRAEARPLFPWMQSRPAQLATFYALLANWLDDRAFLIDRNNIDYSGSDE